MKNDLSPSMNNPSRLLFILFLATALLSACAERPAEQELSNELISQNNRGVALMGRFEYQNAVEAFAEILNQKPDWQTARTNYAIALKNRQGEGDALLAIDELNSILETSPDDVHANYNLGVLQLYLGKIEPAKKYFLATLKSDPSDAYAHYYLGQCLLREGDQLGALTSYQEAIDLDPYLRSAYYSAAQVLRRLDRTEEANQQLALFQRFENNPRAKLAEFKYTRMGPKSLAQVAGDPANQAEAKPTPSGPVLGQSQSVAQFAKLEMVVNMTTVDYNQDGAQDVLITGSKGSRLLIADDNANLVALNENPWATVENINAVAWGDVDNDGNPDAYLCRTGENQLWMQPSPGTWELANATAGVADGDNDCADVALVDADHDGDLDILIANLGAPDNLLNNNRDGTFRSLSAQLNSAAQHSDTQRLLTSDLDSDNDVDLIFVSASGQTTVLLNDRLWNYRASEIHQALQATKVQSITAFDHNADGRNELLSLDRNGELTLWSAENQWQGQRLYLSSLKSKVPVELVTLDLNGNGRAEIVLLAEGAYEILQLSDDLNVTQIATKNYAGGKALPIIRGARGSSLIAYHEKNDATAEILEWPPGQGRFEFITLSFTGKHDAAETMRSNHSGIGTRVSVRKGASWSIADTHKNNSLVGYSLQPVALGLGNHSKADFIAVDWSDGVYQTELDIAAGAKVEIAEEQRQLGSCPVLFVWDGEKFDFVTDILGVAAQGFLVEPGVLLPPRPWERVAFSPGRVVEKDGLVQFKITEPMEENSYIDSMTLEAYDVPSGWELVLDERMGTGAPEVTGEALFYQQAIEPVSAINSQGEDVLDAILVNDNKAMPPGNIDRRFIGLLKTPESLTLEFDQPIDSLKDRPNARPTLMSESWVELPYSQTHFSAWQAGIQFRSVSLEARDAEGNWQSVHPDFGIPAGMPRTISLPLDAVPAGSTAIRLNWNREIYWDRIRIVYTEEAPAAVVKQNLAPSDARVSKSGFYKRVNHAQRRPEYLYQESKTFGDVKYPTGFYTQMGEMTELITTTDDALAIIGPGEEIHVEFAAPSPPAQGFDRWYVLDTRGWAKDKDMYTHSGTTVEPLPRTYPNRDSAKRAELHQKYNIRFQSGR